MQLAAGAAGITVAKIGEAEVLPGDDVLIAYPIMPEKLPRLRALARDRRVTVVVDSVEAARGLPGIGAMVEVDIGVGRAGVTAPEQVVAIAKACSEFRGLFYWPSWLDEEAFKKARVSLDRHLAALKEAGFEVPVVSGGSTPPPPRSVRGPTCSTTRAASPPSSRPSRTARCACWSRWSAPRFLDSASWTAAARPSPATPP